MPAPSPQQLWYRDEPLAKPADLIVAVVGQTASGKSDLSLDVAEGLPAVMGVEATEIVSADALQLYRGMDIGTAKLPVAERRGVVHHQIDVLDVTEEASVASYQAKARADIDAIHARGGAALVVGGSSLYQRALLDRLEFPGTDPHLRASLEAAAQGPLGSRGLHERLAQLDPESAEKINPHNTRRVVRALEVVTLTGRPYSASLPERTFARPSILIAIRHDPDVLDERIATRTRRMFEHGLLDEVRELLPRGLAQGRTASRATGYAQAIAVIEGTLSVEEAIDDVAAATRRLARKQLKWLRPDARVHWIDFDAPEALSKKALELVSKALDAQLATA